MRDSILEGLPLNNLSHIKGRWSSEYPNWIWYPFHYLHVLVKLYKRLLFYAYHGWKMVWSEDQNLRCHTTRELFSLWKEHKPQDCACRGPIWPEGECFWRLRPQTLNNAPKQFVPSVYLTEKPFKFNYVIWRRRRFQGDNIKWFDIASFYI